MHVAGTPFDGVAKQFRRVHPLEAFPESILAEGFGRPGDGLSEGRTLGPALGRLGPYAARYAVHASCIRTAWSGVNWCMQES